jgi:hypothetical protein
VSGKPVGLVTFQRALQSGSPLAVALPVGVIVGLTTLAGLTHQQGAAWNRAIGRVMFESDDDPQTL